MQIATNLTRVCSRGFFDSTWSCGVLLEMNDLNGCIFQRRGYRNYRPPKNRFNYEIRPEPPPFFDKGAKFQESFKKLEKLPQAEQKSLVEGLDYPLLVNEERPRLIACSNAVGSDFTPPRNESSLTNSARAVGRKLSIQDLMAMRSIKQSMGDFQKQAFLETATEVYKNLFTELCRTPMKRNKLMQYCTEYCYPVLMQGLDNCQVRWQYLEAVEPSRIVAAAVNSFMQDDHEFGQIIVRMHSRQVIAIFDRFGRLVKGDPNRPQTVLKYIVFERHMRPLEWSSNWRVHSKIESPATDDVTNHNLKVNLKTSVVPNSFVPQFPSAPPEDPEDPSEWNSKWEDPGYYQLTEEEEEQIKKDKVRKRRLFDMHPTVRV